MIKESSNSKFWKVFVKAKRPTLHVPSNVSRNLKVPLLFEWDRIHETIGEVISWKTLNLNLLFPWLKTKLHWIQCFYNTNNSQPLSGGFEKYCCPFTLSSSLPICRETFGYSPNVAAFKSAFGHLCTLEGDKISQNFLTRICEVFTITASNENRTRFQVTLCALRPALSSSCSPVPEHAPAALLSSSVRLGWNDGNKWHSYESAGEKEISSWRAAEEIFVGPYGQVSDPCSPAKQVSFVAYNKLDSGCPHPLDSAGKFRPYKVRLWLQVSVYTHQRKRLVLLHALHKKRRTPGQLCISLRTIYRERPAQI